MSGTLADRLAARLDEVEDGGWEIHRADCDSNACLVDDDGESNPPPCDCGWPDRVLALVAATRRVIGRHRLDVDECEGCRMYTDWPCADLSDWAEAWGVE